MFHRYWLMAFFFTHTHTHADMTGGRICLTIVRSFRSVTRILAHGISLSHKHGHDRWQNIYLTVVRSFRDVTRMLTHGILFHTHTHTRTWLMTEWYIWQLWEVSEMLHGHWLMAFFPRHTHTHGHDWCQNNISDNCEKFQRYYTDTGSYGILFHTHTHTHRAIINGIHNTIMEKLYQWCFSWCIHTTSLDG